MKRVFSLILCWVLLVSLFSGCGQTDTPYVPTGDGLTWDEDYTGPTNSEPGEEEVQELTLVYYDEISMNPYVCTDYTNRALFSLIYQGLFTVDQDYNVEPMLCSRYAISEDMTTYTFYIDDSATFSDGSKVTIQDVEASLQQARSSKLYSGRFSKVVSISVSEDGGLVMQMTTAYENLPLLLNVPILKADQLEDTRPLGTGPYKISVAGNYTQLIRRNDWWCDGDMTITAPIISLVKAESNTHIRDEFQFGEVDLVLTNPGSDRYVDYLSDFEIWDAENGIFLYLVCHEDSYIFSNEEVRAALTHAIDRDAIVSEFYRGFAYSATLPASPQFPYYNQALASKYAYQSGVFAEAVSNAGLTGWPVKILVNNEDSLRLRVARAIAEMLNEAGLVAEVMTCSSAEYAYYLNNEEYDLHLGQTMLSPNMDLSSFFSSGTSLSYSGLDDLECYTLCQQALENHGNYSSLHKTIMDNGYLCPILFRSYAVYATRGLLTDLTPARDTVFYYSIGKTMEKAYIET